MGLVNRASFEAPLYMNDDSLHVDVLWHGQQVVAINIFFNDILQAVYYPPQPSTAEPSQLERLCRIALARFQSDKHDRQNATNRPAIVLEPSAPQYEGILLSLPGGGAQYSLMDEKQPA